MTSRKFVEKNPQTVCRKRTRTGKEPRQLRKTRKRFVGTGQELMVCGHSPRRRFAVPDTEVIPIVLEELSQKLPPSLLKVTLDLNTGQNVGTQERSFTGSIADYFRIPDLTSEEVGALVSCFEFLFLPPSCQGLCGYTCQRVCGGYTCHRVCGGYTCPTPVPVQPFR